MTTLGIYLDSTAFKLYCFTTCLQINKIPETHATLVNTEYSLVVCFAYDLVCTRATEVLLNSACTLLRSWTQHALLRASPAQPFVNSACNPLYSFIFRTEWLSLSVHLLRDVDC